MMSSLMPSEKYSWPRVLAHVVERQHGDGGALGQRQELRRRVSRFVGFAECCGRFVRLVVGAGRLRVYVAHEAHAPARDGADQLLPLAAVAQRLARGVDAAAQRRFGDDPAAPDRRDKIVLCDNPVAVFHQTNQQVEHLRLDRNGLGPTAQLAQLGVQRMTRKRKLHCAVPGVVERDFVLQKRRYSGGCRGHQGARAGSTAGVLPHPENPHEFSKKNP